MQSVDSLSSYRQLAKIVADFDSSHRLLRIRQEFSATLNAMRGSIAESAFDVRIADDMCKETLQMMSDLHLPYAKTNGFLRVVEAIADTSHSLLREKYLGVASDKERGVWR